MTAGSYGRSCLSAAPTCSRSAESSHQKDAAEMDLKKLRERCAEQQQKKLKKAYKRKRHGEKDE